jgi:apolipoprotein N-acyltransferase
VSAAPGLPPTVSAVRTLAFGLAIPVAAGAFGVLAFAPFYVWPATILAVAALFFVWNRSGSPRQAALSGLAFGLGYFLAGIPWIYISLHDFGAMPAVLAALATFILCVYMALFPAAAGWLAAKVPSGPRRLGMAAAGFAVTEWLRSWLFTGFPWLELGTSQAPASPLAGYAPYVGNYGVSLVVACVAALLVALVSSRSWSRERIVALGGLVAFFVVGAVAPLVEWTRPAGPPVSIGLLQGNVAQEMKWREEVRTRTLIDYRRMILETKARIVVLPETALPAFLDQLPPDYLASLVQHGREQGKEILLCTVEREFRGDEFTYYNSVVRLGPGKMPSYRKRHLVPFGDSSLRDSAGCSRCSRFPCRTFSRGCRGPAATRGRRHPLRRRHLLRGSLRRRG